MRKRVTLLERDAEAMATFGRRLRAARLRRNLSQMELAQRAGVNRMTYAALEAGNSGVSLGCLVNVLSALGYPERFASLLDSDPIGADIELQIGRRRSSSVDDDVADL